MSVGGRRAKPLTDQPRPIKWRARALPTIPLTPTINADAIALTFALIRSTDGPSDPSKPEGRLRLLQSARHPPQQFLGFASHQVRILSGAPKTPGNRLPAS
jgi:hypothetical protein